MYGNWLRRPGPGAPTLLNLAPARKDGQDKDSVLRRRLPDKALIEPQCPGPQVRLARLDLLFQFAFAWLAPKCVSFADLSGLSLVAALKELLQTVLRGQCFLGAL